MTTTHDLDATLRRVQGLMAKADGTDNKHEAEAYRNKAEALMLKYRIDEAMLGASAGSTSGNLKPVWRVLRAYVAGNQFSTTYRNVLAQCISHVDCKAAGKMGMAVDEEGNRWHEYDAVGYDSDLRFAEMLYTSFALAFASKMEPKVNPALSDQENAYLLRSAGLEGKKIAMALWGNTSKANRVKARKLFAQEAVARGEDPSDLLGQGNSVKVFRDSYADGFQQEVWHRLHRMRQANDDTKGALVLKSRRDDVTETYYTKYPHLRPGPANPANAIGGRDTCAKCKAAKSGYCRDHLWLKPSQAQGRPASFSAAGYARGQAAAQAVDLGGHGTRVGTDSRNAIGGA